MLICSVVAYIGLHERSLPPPKWTDADLAVEVVREENGWFVVRDMQDLAPVLLRVRGVVHLEDEESLVADTSTQMDELLRRERFVEECATDACGSMIALEQHALRILHMHHVDSGRRNELRHNAWRHACDYTTNARSAASVDLGLDMLALSLEEAGADFREFACEGLDDVPARAVVAEYLEIRRYFERADSRALFDEREVVAWIGESHSRIYAYALRPVGASVVRPTPAPFGDRMAWWIYNVRGRYWADKFYQLPLDQLIIQTDIRRVSVGDISCCVEERPTSH